jgi:phage-related protein
MIEINFFKSAEGDCPVEEFLDSLTSKQAQKVIWVMQLIEELDKRVPKQYFKKLVNTDDIWEIRVQVGSNIFRILGFFVDKHIFIATNGFQKKTDKTPASEIALAEKRKYEHMRICGG